MAVPDPNGTSPNTAIDPWTQLANFFTSTSGGRANGRLQQAYLDLQRGQLANQQFGQSSQNVTAGGQLANNRFGQQSQNATSGGQLANQQFGQQSTNALNQAEFGLAQPQALAKQAVRGDILANAQDANVQAPAGVPMGTVSGGLRPSMLSSSTRELGGNMARNALLEQMKGPAKIDFPNAPALPTYPTAPDLPTYPTAPGLPSIPEASGLDTALNVGGGITGGLGAAAGLLGGKGSGGSFDLGKAGSALASGFKKLFGGGGLQTGAGDDQGPGYAGASGGYYGPGEVGSKLGGEVGSSNGLTQEEVDALTQYFGGGSGVGTGETQARNGLGGNEDIYQMFGPGGNGMGPGNPNDLSDEEIAALGGYPQDPAGWLNG